MMKRKISFCLFLFFFSLVAAQETSNININKITNDTLKDFVSVFERVDLPFEFSAVNEESVLDTNQLKHLLGIEISDMHVGIEEFYPNYIFFSENFIGLIITRYYTPGAFGINNYFVSIYTLNYNGKLIDKGELGCFCNDTNMGSNDYYSSEPKITVQNNRIIVKIKNTHATLVSEQNEEDNFEEISYESSNYTLNSKGNIIQDD